MSYENKDLKGMARYLLRLAVELVGVDKVRDIVDELAKIPAWKW